MAHRSTPPPGSRPHPPEIDELTLERCRRGDHQAFFQFVKRYERPVFAVISRVTHPSSDAVVEELAQDVFLKAFDSLSNFDVKRSARVSTWLLTIATRVAIDHQRKHSTWREQTIERLPDGAVHDRADDWLIGKQLEERFAELVAELPPENRAAFVLRTYHDYSYQDIAETLGLEIGTVKSRVSRTKQHIIERLKVDHD